MTNTAEINTLMLMINESAAGNNNIKDHNTILSGGSRWGMRGGGGGLWGLKPSLPVIHNL